MRARDASGGRYRGRHRKPRALGKVRSGIRAGVMMACAGLFVCWPQPSWADHADTFATQARVHSVRAHSVRASV